MVLSQELHFAKAAARLHIEQPALSQRIKRLERKMGVQLLVRDTRNVRLSPAGQDFAVTVIELLDRLDSAVNRARETAAGARGVLRISYTISSGYETVPVLIEHLGQVLPHIELEAVEGWETDIVDSVRRGHADAGIIRYDPVDDELVSSLLRRERLVVAMADTHPLASYDEITMAQVRKEQFVMTPTSLAPGYQGLIDDIFTQAGYVPGTVRNAVPGNRLMAVQRQTGAIALLPASARLSRTPGIAFVPVTDEFATLPVRLVHRVDASAAVLLIADTVQHEARRRNWTAPLTPR